MANDGGNVSTPAPPPASGPGTSNIQIDWTPPTTKTDGTALTDLAGYRFYIGTESGAYETTLVVDNPGLSSNLSNEVQKTAN